MGAEDFSYVLQRVPGSMMFLGGTSPTQPGHRPANHSNRVRFDEAAVTEGGAVSGMALRHLAGGEGSGS